jgi:hypothetical protein
VTNPTWEADDPAPAGWPHRPIEDVQQFRLARRAVESLTAVSEVQESGIRDIRQAGINADLLGFPSAEERTAERQLEDSHRRDREEEQEELRELREAVGKGAERRLGLWNSADWASWALFGVPAGLIIAAMWWLS